MPLLNAGKKTREMCETSSACARNLTHFERFFAWNTRYAMKTMRALASNGFHSGSSSSKQCISSRLVHFKGTMRDDITSVCCPLFGYHGPWCVFQNKGRIRGSLVIYVMVKHDHVTITGNITSSCAHEWYIFHYYRL